MKSWKTLCFVCLLSMVTGVTSPAQKFTTLINFDGANGQNPFYVSLIQGRDGNLYGTTQFGGANGDGTVFLMTPNGSLTTIHSFAAPDGIYPYAGLVLGADGNFYGTTSAGGVFGDGTVFKITPGGTLTVLYSFGSASGSEAPLVLGTDGNFYGTTFGGGPKLGGTVFKITPSGVLTTLHAFDGVHRVDGSRPIGGVIQATDGNFYGTTFLGGPDDQGTVFKVAPSGAFVSLHSFAFTDGQNPNAGLMQGSDGDFYGTTEFGGSDGFGVVYKITSSGTFTTLHSFTVNDGAFPFGPLIQATDGNFYGTTSEGNGSYGTLFEITPEGTLTTLHSFGNFDGSSPLSALTQHTTGAFYGVTESGGASNSTDGTVYLLRTGLGPFVESVPISGKVGETVGILGTGLLGATSVTFNGVTASFTVERNSFISAVVPVGATTGPVQVTTASAAVLSSNVNFQVR